MSIIMKFRYQYFGIYLKYQLDIDNRNFLSFHILMTKSLMMHPSLEDITHGSLFSARLDTAK